MGINMVSKGVENVFDFLPYEFHDNGLVYARRRNWFGLLIWNQTTFH